MGMVMNYLELYMRTVKQTFLDYKHAESIMIDDLFHHFVRDRMKEIYKRTIDEYGHLFSDPKYHSEHGSGDITNPNGLYDHELKSGGGTPADFHNDL